MPHPHSSTSACNGRTLARKIKKQRVSWNDTFTKSDSHQRPTNQPTVPLFRLPDIIKEFFSEPDALVAYKGGHFEKDLLHRVGIPSINLESSGFPKAELLFKDLGWVETCGHHLTPNAYHHCPKVEVGAFAMWLS
jgi:hypothetical protein